MQGWFGSNPSEGNVIIYLNSCRGFPKRLWSEPILKVPENSFFGSLPVSSNHLRPRLTHSWPGKGASCVFLSGDGLGLQHLVWFLYPIEIIPA